MSENDIFAPETEVATEPGKKPVYTTGLGLGIASIVFALLIAIVGDILAIVGFVLANRKKETHNVKAAKICCVIGLVLAIANHLLYVVLMG